MCLYTCGALYSARAYRSTQTLDWLALAGLQATVANDLPDHLIFDQFARDGGHAIRAKADMQVRQLGVAWGGIALIAEDDAGDRVVVGFDDEVVHQEEGGTCVGDRESGALVEVDLVAVAEGDFLAIGLPPPLRSVQTLHRHGPFELGLVDFAKLAEASSGVLELSSEA